MAKATSVELVLSTIAGDVEVYVWRVIRERRELRTFRCDHPESVSTWKSRRSYTKLLNDRDPAWAFWQEAARAGGGRGKHVLTGWHDPWEQDAWTFTDGTGTIYFESLATFPRGSDRTDGAYRLAVPVRPGQMLEAWHFLCHPDAAASLLASLSPNERAAVWMCTKWAPWSVVRVGVAEEGSRA